ncbi:MAG: WD40 repeat domain-containing protein [Desulfitobacteriaceae bacterium]
MSYNQKSDSTMHISHDTHNLLGTVFVKISGNGNYVAIVSAEEISIRDTCGWNLLNSFRIVGGEHGHSDHIQSVEVSEDGKLAVTASDDTKLKLWDVQTGTCLNTYVGHDDKVTSVALSQDCKTIISASPNRSSQLWELKSGRCIHTFEAFNWSWNYPYPYLIPDSIPVAISRDGRFIVCGGGGDDFSGFSGDALDIWDLDSMQRISTILRSKEANTCSCHK